VLQGKPSRRLWIAAIAVSVVCLAGLVYGLASDWNTPAAKPLPAGHASPAATGGGLGLGLMIGLGAGVVIGSLLAVRKR
jgi:hypothetical protein